MGYKVAVIGTGTMGQHHARVYSEMNVELVGIVDKNIEQAKTVGERVGANYYSDYNEIIDNIDAVSIAVPTQLHESVAMDFIEKGVDVLIEKPIASTVEGGKRLIKAAKDNDVIMQIGHIERFNSAVRELKKIMGDERPKILECKRHGPYTPRMSSIGVIMDLMIHDIDIARYLLESPLEVDTFSQGKVFSEYEDYALGIFQSGDTKVILSTNRITQKKIRTINATFPDKYITLDYINQDVDIYFNSVPSYISRKSHTSYRHEYIIEKPFISKGEPLKEELLHFIDCSQNHKTPIVTGEDGLYALEMAQKLLER